MPALASESLRAELRELNRQREAMETELAALSDALSADNMGGVSGALIDREGFPRADIDVHGTRTMRHRLACLNTDHRALMQLLETKLHALHMAAAGEGPARVNATAPRNVAAIPMSPDLSHIPNGGADSMVSFARLASVTVGGPAAMAGLRVQDELVRYGHIDATNHDNLRAVARLTSRSEGGYIPLTVRRHSTMVEVTLAPQRWEGPGLLGCHLVPM
jgi:26S proteasome non-ATPase regulatory subunit 9